MRYSLICLFTLAVVLAAQSGAVASGPGSSGMGFAVHPRPVPLSRAAWRRFSADPSALERLIHPAERKSAARNFEPPSRSRWKGLPQAPFNPGAMLQLTDGTLLVQDDGDCSCGSSNWWRLSPDISGSYMKGSWTQAASLPSGYAPLYYASAVLPDGRVIVEGGEYNNGSLVWTNAGAIYDPVADSWTSVAPPDNGSGEWSRIGDGPSTLLADGTFMFGASGYSTTKVEALLDPSKLMWTDTGSGKADGNGEEGWSLLPDGKVLTVDTGKVPYTEIYDPSSGSWSSAGKTPQSLVNGGEIGPQVTRQDGSVFAIGANGHNAVYAPSTGAWSAAPDFPVIGGQQYQEADGPAAVLPNGTVLLMASPGVYQTPSHFFLFDGKTITATDDTPNAADLSSYYGYMLVLPTGQILFNDGVGGLWVYQASGKPFRKSAPSIKSVATTLARGSQYTLKGRQLSGLTQGAAYGDDFQNATNYPLVWIVNNASGHVFYARTTGFTSSVAPRAQGSTQFTVSAATETGASALYVVADGVASKPVTVTVK